MNHAMEERRSGEISGVKEWPGDGAGGPASLGTEHQAEKVPAPSNHVNNRGF